MKNLFLLTLIALLANIMGTKAHALSKTGCSYLLHMKSSLNAIPTAAQFNSQNPVVLSAISAMTSVFEPAVRAKTDQEADAVLRSLSNCFKKTIDPNRLADAREFVKQVTNKERNYEEASFSLIELACAGFTAKELVALVTAKATVGGAAGGAAATVGSASAATIASVAALSLLTGALIAEGITVLDSQTGNNFRRPLNKYIIDPVVRWWMRVPSDDEMILTQSRTLAIRFVTNIKEARFPEEFRRRRKS